MQSFSLIIAVIIDLIIGDPPKIPHPVILIGKLIAKLENMFYPQAVNDKQKMFWGGLLVFIVLLSTFSATFFLIYLAKLIHPFLGFLLSLWFIATTIAIKGLEEAGQKIKLLLEKDMLLEARKQVGYIVGRDTDNLDEKEIVRATVETIAENIVDAITSPLFYAFIGGAPLAMTYRAVNTLDSMLGYRNEKYLYFGKIAARTDDVLNFLPARLTGLFLVIAAYILPGCSGKNALRILLRDKTKHPSPNSGYSESAVAGALQVRIGGRNYYQGQLSQRPFIGDEIISLQIPMIKTTINLMKTTVFLWVLILTALRII